MALQLKNRSALKRLSGKFTVPFQGAVMSAGFSLFSCSSHFQERIAFFGDQPHRSRLASVSNFGLARETHTNNFLRVRAERTSQPSIHFTFDLSELKSS